MRKPFLAFTFAVCAVPLLPVPPAEAQGYMPWPPPPGVAAGEYVPRYVQPQRRPSWQDPRYPHRRYGHGYDPDRTGALRQGGHRGWDGYSRPGRPTPPAGMTWQEYEAYRAGSGGG
jgi:hypothetical protein